MSHSGAPFSIEQKEKSSRPSSSSSSSSSSSCSSSSSSYTTVGPYFFRPGFAVNLLRDSQGRDDGIFKFLDTRSKAKLARTSTLFSQIPEYQTGLRQFNMITKIFFEFVQDGKEDEVLLMLSQYPELHFATAEFTDALTGEKFKRTAYQYALAAEDVGREGCDLCLGNKLGEMTSLEKLALYSDGNPLTPFKYWVEGQERTIASGTNPGQLHPAHFATLKAMYNNFSLLQPALLNLSHEALTEAEQQAYSALLQITSERKHTLFVKEEGMAQRIEQSTRAQSGGELEIARAIDEQFPECCEEEEKKRARFELKLLEDVAEAISHSGTNQDCEGSLKAFRNLVKPRITKTGKHFNGNLLPEALKLWDSKFWSPYDGRKSNLFLNDVFGYIENIGPANYRQAIAQGLQAYLKAGEKLKRSVKAQSGGVLLDGRSGGFWIDISGGALPWPLRRIARAAVFFRAICEQKAVVLRNIMQPRESQDQKHSRRHCIIL